MKLTVLNYNNDNTSKDIKNIKYLQSLSNSCLYQSFMNIFTDKFNKTFKNDKSFLRVLKINVYKLFNDSINYIKFNWDGVDGNEHDFLNIYVFFNMLWSDNFENEHVTRIYKSDHDHEKFNLEILADKVICELLLVRKALYNKITDEYEFSSHKFTVDFLADVSPHRYYDNYTDLISQYISRNIFMENFSEIKEITKDVLVIEFFDELNKYFDELYSLIPYLSIKIERVTASDTKIKIVNRNTNSRHHVFEFNLQQFRFVAIKSPDRINALNFSDAAKIIKDKLLLKKETN